MAKLEPKTRQKPHPEPPQPYEPKPTKPQKDTNQNPPPRSTAKQLVNQPRENLTLADWLFVFQWVDAHPRAAQTDVVRFFASKPDGALNFTQATLSRKLKMRSELESRQHAAADALSKKRVRVRVRARARARSVVVVPGPVGEPWVERAAGELLLIQDGDGDERVGDSTRVEDRATASDEAGGPLLHPCAQLPPPTIIVCPVVVDLPSSVAKDSRLQNKEDIILGCVIPSNEAGEDGLEPDEDREEGSKGGALIRQAIQACRILETAAILFGESSVDAPSLVEQLQMFRARLFREQNQRAAQTRIDTVD